MCIWYVLRHSGCESGRRNIYESCPTRRRRATRYRKYRSSGTSRDTITLVLHETLPDSCRPGMRAEQALDLALQPAPAKPPREWGSQFRSEARRQPHIEYTDVTPQSAILGSNWQWCGLGGMEGRDDPQRRVQAEQMEVRVRRPQPPHESANESRLRQLSDLMRQRRASTRLEAGETGLPRGSLSIQGHR